jgi:RHS repeat-associated protein
MSIFYNSLLPDTVIPSSSLEADSLREAYRALKGHILRTEVYADDGSPLASIPYTVHESNFTIEVLQPLQDAHIHSIYTVRPRETINYNYEREIEDPRIHHEMILQLDSYGNVLKRLQIAYGRQQGKSQLTGLDKTKQEATSFLYSEQDVTKLLDTQSDYRIPTQYEIRAYELSGFRLPTGTTRFPLSSFDSNNFLPLTSLPEIPYESKNDANVLQKRLLQQHRILFRKDNLSGLLPAGEVQSLAVPAAEYTLWATPGLLTNIFKRQTPNQPVENLIPDPKSMLGGIGDQQGGYVDLDNNGSWWQVSGKVFFHLDPTVAAAQELAEAQSSFFQPRAFLDPFGNKKTVNYDPYNLFTVSSQDAVGNSTAAVIDYRVLAPTLLTDPNGNQTAVKFDALGMVAGNIIMGRPGEKAGDSFDNFRTDLVQADIDSFFADPTGPIATTLLGTATSRIVVDQTCFWHNNLPTYQALISRETHVNDLAAGEITKIQVTLTYSDGFGQAIQTKTQTKAGPLTDGGTNISSRWISSSWKIFNNKGKTVRQYEPFFDDTHEFKFAIKVGVSPIMMYDPLSRLVATLNQDHSLEKVVFDPWSHTTYDASDNVKISNPKSDADVGHFFDSLPEYEYLPSWYDARIGGQLGPYEKTAAIKTQAHANTPHVTHLDPLEHVILAIDDNGQGDLHYTRFSYDVQGHQLNSTDALNRLVVTCDYSIAGSKIHAASMEAGETWTLPNVLGQDFMLWNSRNFRFRSSYDAARRLTEQWVRDGGAVEVMVQQNVYGELVPNATVHNLRGKIFKSRDQAGEITSNDFDFKGNASSASRLLASNYRDTLNWSTSVDLEPSLLTSMYTYDALNRVVKSIATDASTSYRYYNKGGYTEQLFVNVRGEQASTDPTSWTPIFTQVEHNAKSQLTKIFHGNGIIIQRSYEPLFSHLSRIQTTRTSDGSVLQDLNYTFDAVGNVSRVGDNAQQTVYFRNNRVDPSSEFTYDPLFRLISATGREHLGQTNGTANAPVAPGAMDATSVISPTDGNAMGSYSETYVYDAVGNMLSLSHAGSDPQNPGWKRVYSYNESSQLEPAKKSNRLSATTVGSISENYKYDDQGNVISMPYLPSMQWDFQNQLRSTSKQIVTNGGTPETTYYVYDSKGKRIRKVTESQAGPGSAPVPVRTKERIYLGSLDIFRTFTSNGTDIDLELVDLESRSESGRVAIIETRTSGSSPAPQRVIRFQYGNFIGSASLELDQEARIITYEEYFPFGASAYRSVTSQNDVPNRYRYSGKEKDDENGLYYYGARYYASWLCRWVSTDPGGFVDGPNLYEFVKCNPITLQDPDGREVGVGGGVGVPTPGTPPPGILAEQGLKDLAIEQVEKGVVRTTVRTVVAETGEAIAPRVLPGTARILSVGGGALLAGILAGVFVFFRNESHELSPSEERKYLEEDRRRERLKLPGPDNLPDHTGPVPAPAPDPQLLPPHESPPPGAPVVPEHRDPIDAQEHRRPVEKIKEKLPEKQRDKPRRKKRDDDWEADWHHSIPQNHLDDFKDIININDKAEGRVLPLWYHKLITPGLTKDWDQFVIDHTVDGKFEGTEKDIKDFQKKMDRKWKTGLFQRPPWNFHSGQQSRETLTEWVKRHGWLRTGN